VRGKIFNGGIRSTDSTRRSINSTRVAFVVIDKPLTQEVSKKESPQILKHLSMSKIELCNHSLKIYTDSSKTSDNRKSAAFYVSKVELEDNVRQSNNLQNCRFLISGALGTLNWSPSPRKGVVVNTRKRPSFAEGNRRRVGYPKTPYFLPWS